MTRPCYVSVLRVRITCSVPEASYEVKVFSDAKSR